MLCACMRGGRHSTQCAHACCLSDLAQVYRNMLHAAQGIVAERGLAGLYSGLGVTVLEIMPYAALQFGVYDSLQAAWKESKVNLRAT
jgi:hypothetical protein